MEKLNQKSLMISEAIKVSKSYLKCVESIQYILVWNTKYPSKEYTSEYYVGGIPHLNAFWFPFDNSYLVLPLTEA